MAVKDEAKRPVKVKAPCSWMKCGADMMQRCHEVETKVNQTRSTKKEMKRVANDDSRDRMREVCEQKTRMKRNGR